MTVEGKGWIGGVLDLEAGDLRPLRGGGLLLGLRL